MIKKKQPTKSDATNSNAAAESKAGGSTSVSAPIYSRDVIAKHFRQTADLTTIQLTDTILFKPGDADQGAKLFRERFRVLFANRSTDSSPVLIWLARDLSQLRHVVKETKKEDPELFDQLAAHAIYAKAKGSNPFYQALEKNPIEAVGTGHQVLTASLVIDEDDHHYAYYGHFSPEVRGDGWQEGPHCEALAKVPKLLDQLVKDLHGAHAEIIRGTDKAEAGQGVKKLEKSDIFPKPLASIEN